PDTCAVYLILKAFGSPEAVENMKHKLLTGKGYGYGHAKLDLLAEHERVFGSKRELYEHYVNTPKEVWAKMEPGYVRAQSYAREVRARAREALGLLAF